MKVSTSMEFEGRALSVEVTDEDARYHYASKGQEAAWDELPLASRHAVMMALADLMVLDLAGEDSLLSGEFVENRKIAVAARMKRQLSK